MSKPIFLRVRTAGGSLSRMSSRKINFCCEPANFESGRQRCGKFHDAVIEKRRADLQRMSHAHAVAFGEDIVGQVVFLIEPKKCSQRVFVGRQFRHFLQNLMERVRKSHAQQSGLFQYLRMFHSNRCGRGLGCRRLPSKKRWSLYSRPIFSSETGHCRIAAKAKRRAMAGTARACRAR